ncbi:MAG: Flp family type IVb pilin [Acetobacteraceae bacterium]
MFSYLATWMQLKTDCRAVTALEYGLIAGLVAVVIVTGVTLIGTNLSTMFTGVAGKI